jgi:hypothetical protein
VRALKEYFSINTLHSAAAKAAALVERFPASILLVALMAFYYDRHLLGVTDFFISPYDRQFFPVRWYAFLTFGVFICTAAALWLEDVAGYAKRYAITAGIAALWGVYCFYLPTKYDDMAIINRAIEALGIGMAATLSIYFTPFLRKSADDKAFWNFAVTVTFQYNLAACFGMIIFAGLCGAFLVVDALFSVEIPGRAYTRLMSVCLVLFAQIYFLANIPGKTAKHGSEIRLGSSVKALGLYVLAPLAAVYAVILYVYLFKILFAWELPQGLVSYLVSTLACVGFLTVMILYPARLEEKNRIILYISRYFGLTMLPLLALMTVGVFRRVGDYGITIPRGYLISINLWLYFACLYHFFTKARRIKWILISFTAVVLLTSLRFCGIPDVTRYILTAQVRGYTGNQKISLTDKALFDNVGLENRKKAVEKIRYLRHTYGFESVRALFDKDIDESNVLEFSRIWESEEMPEPETAEQDEDVKFTATEKRDDYINFSSGDHGWGNYTWNTGGYNSVAFVKYYPGASINNNRHIQSFFKNNQLTVKINKKTFLIPLSVRDTEELKRYTAELMYLRGGDYTVLIDRFEGRYYKSADSIRLDHFEGYLFYNK